MEKKYIVTINGQSYEVVIDDANGAKAVSSAPAAKAEQPAAPVVKKTPAPQGGTQVKSPLPGTLLRMNVKDGQSVKKGDLLCIVEAMKMENEILSPCDGTVSIASKEGSSLNSGDLLFTIA
ncbi:MAG: biotin/lipoyl-binding protein [Clostridia bacterium]|nr:biotin/lipoyl-binding protein [Clostridia bacterium]